MWKIVDYHYLPEDAISIRESVFVKEQGFSRRLAIHKKYRKIRKADSSRILSFSQSALRR